MILTDKEKVQMYSKVSGKYLAISYNKTYESEVERKREEENLKRKHLEYENY
jgi:inner membrane protein involved in colicin E2 resistance